MQEMQWLPNPPDGTEIVLGFDGALTGSADCTALRAETLEGMQFTPRYGPDGRPTIWVPDEWGGEYERSEIHAAVDEVFHRYKVRRMYCDPFWWETEIGDWAQEYGDEVVMEWRTNRAQAMFESISRFEIDLRQGRITHDGCPITTEHVTNAVKKSRKGQIYLLDKPDTDGHRKIDAAMASILAHEAWADQMTDGWGKDDVDNRVFCFR